jgi:hypothetical protein
MRFLRRYLVLRCDLIPAWLFYLLFEPAAIVLFFVHTHFTLPST